MKTAVYIEDGVTQVVITPENDFEKSVISTLHDEPETKVMFGQFYGCQGGWIRHENKPNPGLLTSSRRDRSLIIRCDKATNIGSE